jgi:hypothetical protein
VQDLVELIDVVAAFEERLPAEELGEDAAYRPDVDLCDTVSPVSNRSLRSKSRICLYVAY